MEYRVEGDLGEFAEQVLEAHDRERRRQLAIWARIAFLVVAPAVAALTWLATVGYHRHVLEITTGGRTFRIVSHKSPFEIFTPAEDFAKTRPGGGVFDYFSEDFTDDHVRARSYEWASITTTRQRVRLPDGMIDYQFFINSVPFSLTRAELHSGESRWQAESGETREINVDRLSPPKPQPITFPSPAR